MGIGLAFVPVVRDAQATCLNFREEYLFLKPGLLQAEETIHVYLNAADTEGGPACPYDIRRTGLSIEDAENILRAVLVSINDSSATTPRLIYGGRVCHDTLIRRSGDAQAQLDFMTAYLEAWEAEMPSEPPGIVVQASPCAEHAGPGELVSATAWAESFNRGPLDSDELLDVERRSLPGAGHVMLKAFQDDAGVLCPRISFPPEESSEETFAAVGNGKEECHLDPGLDPTGQPCTMPGKRLFTCTCFDLLAADNNNYPGYYVCFDPNPDDDIDEHQWSPCKCRNRGYEAWNIGDGSMHPLEPPRCDALGPADTKDLHGILLHELGHLLGLGHAGISETCFGPESADNLDTTGIMSRKSWPSRTRKGLHYFPDDLRGLDWLYTTAPPGEPEPPSQDGDPHAGAPAFNTAWSMIYYESSDAGQTWGPPQPLPLPEGLDGTSTRVSVTSATDGSGFQAVTVGGGAPDHPVYVLTRDEWGFEDLSLADAQVPGASSRYPAAIAYGGERLAVAWIEQGTSSPHATLAWGVNDLQLSQDWVTTDLANEAGTDLDERIIRQDLGLGYAPSTELFVLVATSSIEWSPVPDPLDPGFPDLRDSGPWLLLINPADGSLIDRINLTYGMVAHSIGKPICHALDANTDGCVLPVSRVASGGPSLAMLPFRVFQEQGGLPSIYVIPSSIQVMEPLVLGPIDNAGTGLPGESDTIFGTFTSVGDETEPWFSTFELATFDSDFAVSEVSVADLGSAPGALGAPLVPSWSLSVGSRRSEDEVVTSVWRVEPDQPDGGTTDAGMADEGGGLDGESGEPVGTDGPQFDGDAGCECGSSGRPERDVLVMLGLFVLGASRIGSRGAA